MTAHALVGWALCFATIGIGMRVTTVQAALIVHAIGAPIYFCAISFFYFRRFAFTTPLQTAFAFTGIVISLDFFLVALVILKNLDMFASLLGTWIPFALIFTSTWVTGLLVKAKGGNIPSFVPSLSHFIIFEGRVTGIDHDGVKLE